MIAQAAASGGAKMLDFDGDKPVVLVIGTDHGIRTLIVENIRKASYSALQMTCGPHVLDEIVHVVHFEVAVIDVNCFENHAGAELTRIIHDRSPEVGIIITSENIRVEPDGMPKWASFICEPRRNDKLIKSIRALLTKASD